MSYTKYTYKKMYKNFFYNKHAAVLAQSASRITSKTKIQVQLQSSSSKI